MAGTDANIGTLCLIAIPGFYPRALLGISANHRRSGAAIYTFTWVSSVTGGSPQKTLRC
jgi:hypothetical protein